MIGMSTPLKQKRKDKCDKYFLKTYMITVIIVRYYTPLLSKASDPGVVQDHRETWNRLDYLINYLEIGAGKINQKKRKISSRY